MPDAAPRGNARRGAGDGTLGVVLTHEGSSPADRLRRVLVRHVEAGTMPGAVGTIGAELDPIVVGAASIDGAPLRPDAIFRIQSMTKTVTAVAALQLVQDGRIGLERSFRFEYSHDGTDRHVGRLVLQGSRMVGFSGPVAAPT